MSVQGPRNRLLAHPARQFDPAMASDGRVVDADIVLVTRPQEFIPDCTNDAEPVRSTGRDPAGKHPLPLDDRSGQRGPRGCGHIQRDADHGCRLTKETDLLMPRSGDNTDDDLAQR